MPIPKVWPMAGTQVAVMWEVFDETGEPANPTTVTVTVRSPSGVIAATTTHPGTGIYRTEFTTDVGGTWVVQFVGTAPVVVVEEIQFDVRFPVIVVEP